MARHQPAVAEYLRELERALRDLQPDRRDEIVTEIEAHIDALLAEHGPSPSEADTRNVLERVGSPHDIARETRDDIETVPRRRRWTDVAAVIALPIPVLGWVVGGALLWLSDVWSTRDKIIGTVAGPGLFVLGGLSLVGASNDGRTVEPAVADPPGAVPDAAEAGGVGGGEGFGPLELLVLGLVFLLPLATSIYLARKLRTQSEQNGRSSGPGGTSVVAVSAIAFLVLPLLLVVLEADPTPAAMFLLWGAGLVLLWLSDAWTTREKTLATLIAPGGGTLALLLLQGTDSDVRGLAGVAMFASAALVPPIYLGRSLLRPHRSPGARDLADAH